ncbi:MAG: hypothetical protein KBF56_02810 [Gemmatimonadaceae bacterium]|nr:hypothetical protein [Gemmatimonadaceae bacterium]
MRGALLLSLLAFPAASLAQSPACPGSEPMRGEALNPRIRALYESATGRRNLRPRELDEVIALATEQCRSGDDRGLVWRAAARYALACGGEGACERPDAGTREALRRAVGDLDDWLAAHPRASLNRPQLEFIAPLDVGLARYVAQVRVVSRPAGVVARLGDSLMHDGVPLRTIGPATVSVTSVQHEALTIELPAEAGTVTSLAIVESPDAPVVGDARRVALRRLVASMPGSPSVANVAAPEDRLATPRPLRPWAIAAAVSAGAFAAAGIGFTLWREDRSASYLLLGCGASSTDGACLSAYDRFETAKGLQVASFVAAGVFVGGAVALWLLDRRDAGRSLRRADGSRGCDVVVGGLRCAW